MRSNVLLLLEIIELYGSDNRTIILFPEILHDQHYGSNNEA